MSVVFEDFLFGSNQSKIKLVKIEFGVIEYLKKLNGCKLLIFELGVINKEIYCEWEKTLHIYCFFIYIYQQYARAWIFKLRLFLID